MIKANIVLTQGKQIYTVLSNMSTTNLLHNYLQTAL